MPSEATIGDLNDLLLDLDAQKREIDRRREAVHTTIRLLKESSRDGAAQSELPPAPNETEGDDPVPW